MQTDKFWVVGKKYKHIGMKGIEWEVTGFSDTHVKMRSDQIKTLYEVPKHSRDKNMFCSFKI